MHAKCILALGLAHTHLHSSGAAVGGPAAVPPPADSAAGAAGTVATVCVEAQGAEGAKKLSKEWEARVLSSSVIYVGSHNFSDSAW